MEKIKVEAKFGYTPVEDVADIDLEPSFVIFDIKREGKNGFESTVKIPVGDVPTEEFVKAVKVLYLASQAFHHHIYTRLREKMEELDVGKRDVLPLLEKDQRGS